MKEDDTPPQASSACMSWRKNRAVWKRDAVQSVAKVSDRAFANHPAAWEKQTKALVAILFVPARVLARVIPLRVEVALTRKALAATRELAAQHCRARVESSGAERHPEAARRGRTLAEEQPELAAASARTNRLEVAAGAVVFALFPKVPAAVREFAARRLPEVAQQSRTTLEERLGRVAASLRQNPVKAGAEAAGFALIRKIPAVVREFAGKSRPEAAQRGRMFVEEQSERAAALLRRNPLEAGAGAAVLFALTRKAPAVAQEFAARHSPEAAE